MYARFSATINIKTGSCRTIQEEPTAELDLEQLKRRHRPTQSPAAFAVAPQLISTTITPPVHILSSSSNMSSSLLPRNDLSARVRGTSHIDFKTATTGIAAKAMRNEISRLVSSVEDPITKRVSLLTVPRKLQLIPLM